MKPSSTRHQWAMKAHHNMYHVTYSMTIFNDALRGLHNVSVFRRFLEMWFLDIAVFGKLTKVIPENLQKIDTWIFYRLFPLIYPVRKGCF